MTQSIYGLASLAAISLAFPLSGAEYRITGPHPNGNLSVYLIHGPNRTPRHFLTLQEALAQKKAVVFETGRVNELAIQNLSQTEDVYVQSGDIVKGGQQDRTLKDDLIIPSNSGKVSISSFCVEHGRWSQRGAETITRFESSSQAVATREVKIAMNLAADQSEVWSKVAETQRKLSSRVGGAVAAPASPSSFMLSLESPRLQKPVEDHIRALTALGTSSPDVVGYAFAVNGKLSSADVYASNDMFRKQWAKLLRSSAVEAIADSGAGKPPSPPTIDAVRTFLAGADKGNSTIHDLTPRTRRVTRETDREALFETRDRAQSDGWIHRSYLVK